MAKWAEKLGYVMLAVPEHHIIPREHVELSGPHYLNAYTAMAHFAGATETIRVNSCVGLLPTQNPIITAKALSTMDWLSSGRVTATFGVGWLKEEFDLLGLPFAQRGAMAEEYTQAIIELWTKENPEFEGKYVSFKDVAFEPKCAITTGSCRSMCAPDSPGKARSAARLIGCSPMTRSAAVSSRSSRSLSRCAMCIRRRTGRSPASRPRTTPPTRTSISKAGISC